MSGIGVIYCHYLAVRAGSAVMGSGADSWNLQRHVWIVFKTGLSIRVAIITTLRRWEGGKEVEQCREESNAELDLSYKSIDKCMV